MELELKNKIVLYISSETLEVFCLGMSIDRMTTFILSTLDNMPDLYIALALNYHHDYYYVLVIFQISH